MRPVTGKGGKGSAAKSRREDDPRDETSVHVRRAEAGNGKSLQWVVERFSPLLLAQANYRMGAKLRAFYDVDDLVNDVWAIALPRLAELGAREGRSTPVLVRFLATTLLHRVQKLLKRYIAESRRTRAGGNVESDGDGDSAREKRPIENLAAQTSGVVTHAVRRELQGVVASALAELEPRDREILLLRGLEQNSNGTVALLLGLAPSAVTMRYRRALERLRARLPGSVFDQLPGE